MSKYIAVLPQMQVEIGDDMGLEEIEEALREAALKQAHETCICVLNDREEKLFLSKPKDLRSEGYRERYIATTLGTIRFKRRLYKEKGNLGCRYLLDESLKIEQNQRVSLSLAVAALESAARESYREAEREIERWTGEQICHEAIRQMVLKAGKEIRKSEGCMWEEEGPCEEKEILFLQADGCHVPLQREATRRAEVKAAVFYDGREPRYATGKGFALKGKHIYAGLERADIFCEKLSLFGELKAGASWAENLFISSDGASWIKRLREEYPDAIFHLDWYHIRENITKRLPGNRRLQERLYEMIQKGNAAGVIDELKRTQENEPHKKAKVLQLAQYLERNLEDIYGYRKVPAEIALKHHIPKGTGAIEGNIGVLFKQRIKGRGMSWSRRGLDAMVKLKTCILRGELGNLHLKTPAEEMVVEMPDVRKLLPRGAWESHRMQEALQAKVPVLHGSAPYAPAIRKLVYGKEGMLP